MEVPFIYAKTHHKVRVYKTCMICNKKIVWDGWRHNTTKEIIWTKQCTLCGVWVGKGESLVNFIDRIKS